MYVCCRYLYNFYSKYVLLPCAGAPAGLHVTCVLLLLVCDFNQNWIVLRSCLSSGCQPPASHCLHPGSIPGQVMWIFWCAECRRGEVSRSALVSPPSSHSANCSTFSNHPIIDPVKSWYWKRCWTANLKYVCVGRLQKNFSIWNVTNIVLELLYADRRTGMWRSWQVLQFRERTKISDIRVYYGFEWDSNCKKIFTAGELFTCRSQWSHCLRHEPSSPARTLGSWVRIPLKAWMFVFCVYVVLYVGSGLTTGW
jgi:hypothetical protein